MLSRPAKDIIATLAYYDGLDYPLTLFEIWKYLMWADQTADHSSLDNTTLAIITEALKDPELKKHIEESGGFYFLRGRKELVEKRIAASKIANEKTKRLRRVVSILRFVPYVRMIGVTGKLAMKMANQKSDWDLLVVLKKGKIWTGRTLVTGITHLMGKRRHGAFVTDRVCLNYFITDQSLKLSTRDLFSASEYFFLFPLFDAGVFKSFQLKNAWIRKYKPNYTVSEEGNLKIIPDTGVSRGIRTLGEKVLSSDILERWLKKWQKKKIMENPKTRQKGSFIQASDEALIFLPEPQGPELFEKFRNRMTWLGIE
ncbi:MAG: hypothetical protein NT136_00985 [Candidatus Moranbacteria bacterium]|nr:hypothetical protein [Candidatus Moranbacteria bacterium]